MPRVRSDSARGGGRWFRELRTLLAPRDAVVTAYAGAGVLMACAVTLVSNAISAAVARGDFHHGLTRTALTELLVHDGLVPAILVVLSAMVIQLRGKLQLAIGAPAAIAGLGVVVWVNWASHDTSAGGQYYLLFPVMYGAYHLRTAAAYLVTACAIVMEICFVIHFMSWGAAVHDAVIITLVLVAATAMITYLRDRQEAGERLLTDQASQDSLTGLATRRVFEDTAAVQLPQHETGLILVDLDHFKQINDTYGHPVGDEVLCAAAAHLKAITRANDLVARLGGDEFAVLLSMSPAHATRGRAESIVRRIAATPVRVDGPGGAISVPVSVSVGVASGHQVPPGRAVPNGRLRAVRGQADGSWPGRRPRNGVPALRRGRPDQP